jgi:hypothetical protein
MHRFFNLVVLPRVRDDIAEFKKLNVHLYQALKKCLFKPQVFFKGILLPLCEVSLSCSYLCAQPLSIVRQLWGLLFDLMVILAPLSYAGLVAALSLFF